MVPSRRLERETRARSTVQKAIPDILSRSPRAKHGISQAHVIVDPRTADKTPTAANLFPREDLVIRIESSDPLQAAARLSERPYAVRREAGGRKEGEMQPNVTIHNMASLSRPGGGFLVGANSQEEFICARTTLYASLSDDCYPLPDVGGIYTPDVLVFRDVNGVDYAKRDRFFVNVISAGVFRHCDARTPYEEEAGIGCSCGVSYCDKDRDLMMRKMKAVMRIAQVKGAKQLILGAWGCGGLNHPVKEVAKLWRKVVAGSPRQRRPNAEQWEGIDEVIFAIPNNTHAREFRTVFDDILAPELSPYDSDSVGADFDRGGQMARLVASAASLELQLEQAQSALLKGRLREDLMIVNQELALGRAAKAARDEDSAGGEDVEDGFVVDGFQASDCEDASFYSVDDVGDSDSDGPTSDTYEFRYGRPPSSDSHASQDEDDELLGASDWVGYSPSPHFDPQTGWFQGSIDQLSAHVLRTGKNPDSGSISPRSPLVRRESSAANETDGGVNGFLARYQTSDGIDRR